ncbi:sulfotransferase family 2 domain-containing protein [Bacillus sp. V2I10]|uniref:sulfotransferase family 2 domain-containing protein n=1 Tax=Bacillus sp. V2I10 TaxID=3042276 RepID=UPI00277E5D63|nr:sulfotransferase family 2 domain-containing protein [Bacillus sp. V2I10]MDQ0859692.1 hypothetical protein [Bacillus sp. V2I10]
MNHKDKLLIFMHIPKTGGTTLHYFLKNQYNENVQCYQRKTGFGLHRHFSKPCIYITMMRDPVERIISLYYYIRRNENHRWHSKVKELSLDQFITNKEFEHENVNLQTRYFCDGQTPNLEQAKKNLYNHFSIVGITELFDDSLSLMKHELGWKSVQYQKRNVTKNRKLKSDFPTKTIDKIIQNNTLDLELYKYAKNILKDKIQNI